MSQGLKGLIAIVGFWGLIALGYLRPMWLVGALVAAVALGATWEVYMMASEDADDDHGY